MLTYRTMNSGGR